MCHENQIIDANRQLFTVREKYELRITDVEPQLRTAYVVIRLQALVFLSRATNELERTGNVQARYV